MEKRTIEEIRKEKGLTQEQVASQCFISPSYFCYIERGDRIPSIKTGMRIAEILGIPLDELLEVFLWKVQ